MENVGADSTKINWGVLVTSRESLPNTPCVATWGGVWYCLWDKKCDQGLQHYTLLCLCSLANMTSTLTQLAMHRTFTIATTDGNTLDPARHHWRPYRVWWLHASLCLLCSETTFKQGLWSKTEHS